MIRVKCKDCGNIGYTSSPGYVICKCGGRFKVVLEKRQNQKVELDEQTLRLFDFSNLINDEDNGSFN